MASTSGGPKTLFPVAEAASNFYLYPAPLAKFDDIMADSRLFMQTLGNLHHSMGTKFMIPIIGGKELDLHRLFLDVTSRGGIQKVIRERKWKEVTAGFDFPSTATNASFVLRKYYGALLYHYEQIYYFKAVGWACDPSDALRNPLRVPVPPAPRGPQFPQPPVSASGLPEAISAASVGTPVAGVIDGKFDSGYLVTVTVGSEKLKGVLYQAPQNPALLTMLQRSAPVYNPDISSALGVYRRRRKKSGKRKRAPDHPKPNRSGYNFFFAEQHARLKPLHQGKDREISRIIGELWNKLGESEKAVYQEQALKDKERYKAEMEKYREKQKTGQGAGDAMPQPQIPDKDMMDADLEEDDAEGSESPQIPDESCSGESDYDDDTSTEHDMDMDAHPSTKGAGAESSVGAESSQLGAEKPSKEKEGNDDGDQHAQNMDENSSMTAK